MRPSPGVFRSRSSPKPGLAKHLEVSSSVSELPCVHPGTRVASMWRRHRDMGAATNRLPRRGLPAARVVFFFTEDWSYP
jgi:hypothetical protein